MGRIVVGIDGSDESQAALRWSIEEAAVRGATLEVVYVYQYTPEWQLYGYAGSSSEEFQAEQQAREAAEDRAAAEQAEALVRRLIADAAPPAELDVQVVAMPDRRPAEALIERSKGADLLVVGSRGRGGFTGLLLGSVSHQVATHAHCPVVILPQGADGS